MLSSFIINQIFPFQWGDTRLCFSTSLAIPLSPTQKQNTCIPSFLATYSSTHMNHFNDLGINPDVKTYLLVYLLILLILPHWDDYSIVCLSQFWQQHNNFFFLFIFQHAVLLLEIQTSLSISSTFHISANTLACITQWLRHTWSCVLCLQLLVLLKFPSGSPQRLICF